MEPSPKATILILENEPIVLRSTAKILREEGYEVYEAASAPEAHVVVDAVRKAFPLLICDLALDGLQGRDAAATLQSLRPEMRVLFMMSGSDGARFRPQLERERRYFLRKPFDRRRLLECVAFVLGGWAQPADAPARSA
jgi:DNA-binding NtrC family response regulator